MEISNTILTEPVRSPDVLPDVRGIENASDEQLKKLAMDFESVFVGKMLEEMDKTIGDWGQEQDSGTRQIKGIFNLCLTEHIGHSGGLGLWKEIHQSLQQMQRASANNDGVDTKL